MAWIRGVSRWSGRPPQDGKRGPVRLDIRLALGHTKSTLKCAGVLQVYAAVFVRVRDHAASFDTEGRRTRPLGARAGKAVREPPVIRVALTVVCVDVEWLTLIRDAVGVAVGRRDGKRLGRAGLTPAFAELRLPRRPNRDSPVAQCHTKADIVIADSV